jgi:hypothetical protein
VDLEQRGLLRIDEIPGDDQDWLLTDRRDQAADRDGLAGFEATLLDGLFVLQSAIRLGETGQALIPVLNRVRTQLHRDAVRQGWLRRWPRHGRTQRSEELLAQIQSFRTELRRLAGSWDAETMARLAPYAIGFGLGPSATIEFGAEEGGTTQRREDEVPWGRTPARSLRPSVVHATPSWARRAAARLRERRSASVRAPAARVRQRGSTRARSPFVSRASRLVGR